MAWQVGGQLARCYTTEAQALMARPPKVVKHRCGYPFLTQVVDCWGPQDQRGRVFSITKVLVGYWDEARQQVFTCPCCRKELQVWWPYP